ncbi:MAG: hypothetical protein JWR67_2227, partial [Mucilaginibacter sp.]|nr:hypothetical protein [Mucilaginibacter sp.]
MKLKLFGFKICITVFIVIVSFLHGYSQSCGLGFYSHDVVQDKRTGLNLNPGNAWSATIAATTYTLTVTNLKSGRTFYARVGARVDDSYKKYNYS